jgi:hypothetical protein
MRYRYRYVGFGTRFSREKGRRPEGERDPSKLYGNELALDVGGVCLGHADVDHHIIDHHFYRREGQYPAAAAAVLHLAPRIVERFGDEVGDVWLVSHRDPDFDALGSMYLVRCLLEGTIPARDWESCGLRPDGWYQGRSEIDWFQPKAGGLPPDRRWPILIAAYAACVDNGRRLACPRNRSLHSVLYAAMARGRGYQREDDGALEFFGEVRRNLKDSKQGLNPLIDSVLEQSEVFAPERAMLDREVEAYRRDIRRARRAVVFLQESTVSFQEWFPKVQSSPLLKSDGSLDPAHLRPPDQGRSQVEGVYIRDPECLLFKEWARLDTEHSVLGQGFLFTAVAYSRGRREATVNQTDYYFALDPERAGGRHLYNVWARLQAEEGRPYQGCPPGGSVRSGFEGRATGSEAAFVDPWFDGHNYACTIVVTPNQGTGIAPAGTAGDLSDDRVALLVQQELELSVFASDVTVHDLAASNAARPEPGRSLPITEALKALSPPPRSCYRFARVQLEDHVETLEAGIAAQIGRVLWRVLDPDGSEGPPDEALGRHLVVDAESVSVWSRRGVVVAGKAAQAAQAAEIERSFEALAKLARDVETLLETPQDRVARGESLMRQIARLRHELALDQTCPPRSLF